MLLIQLWIFSVIIDRFAVSSGNSRHIERCFHPSFNLEAVNSGIQKIRNMLDHAEIFGIKNISSSFIFVYWQIFSRTFFLHDCIFPAAGMGTGSLIGISARKIAAEQTSAGIRNTHGSMDKCLDLQVVRNVCPDLFDLLHG